MSRPPEQEGITGVAGDEKATSTSASGGRLISAVMFVHDLDSSVAFYRRLLGMRVTVSTETAALLVGQAGSQLYLRSMGPDAPHPLGSVGVQYLIWIAADEEDLNRCERFLKDAGVHVATQTHDEFKFVEGRDPNDVPVMVTYPGPDQAERREILARIYAW